MSQWKLEINDEARIDMEKAVRCYPYLRGLLESRLQALLAFPPTRWFRIHRQAQGTCFFPESGQKIRLTGMVDFKTRRILILRFSLRP